MAKFKDTEGREWTLRVNVATVEDVLEATGVDLYALDDEQFQGWAKLMRNPPKLGAVLFALCFKQIEERKLDKRAFAEGLLGDSLQGAAKALREAVTDFCPDPKLREALRVMEQKGEAYQDELLSQLESEMARVDPREAARQTVANLTRQREQGVESGNVPESLASTLDPSRSDNSTT